MIQVKAFQIPQINWVEFDKDCKTVTGISPLKKLDEQAIDKNDPSAFPSTLPLETSPIENISDFNNPAFEVVNCGFTCITPSNFVPAIIQVAPASYLINGHEGESLIIMTGTLASWIRRITAFSRPSTNKHARSVANQCMDILRQAGVKVWENFTRYDIDGDTYALQKR